MSRFVATGSVKLFKSYKPEYKDGEQMRDFIYVKDAVDVTLHFALQALMRRGAVQLRHGQAADMGGPGEGGVYGDGLEPKIEFIEMPEELQGKYQYFTEAKVEKLRGAGYARPFTILEDGVRDYIQGYYLPREG